MLISWNTTKKCNLYCRHCYRDSGPEAVSPDELNTVQGKTLLEQMKQAGFKMVILSGGEPLLRQDIFELAAYAVSIGLRPVLGSNGILIGEAMAQKIIAAGINGIAISLDSASAAYHDQFRGLNGAWEQTIQGIKNSLAAGLRVQINTTLTENNFDQFHDIVDLVTEIGVQALHPFFLVPTGRGINLEEESLKQEKYFQMIDTILRTQKETAIELKPTCAPQFLPMAKEMGLQMRFTRGCLAGVGYCCILPDGDVHICPYLPVKVGNVKETPFDRIWAQSEIFQKLRDYQQYEGRCGQCPNIAICGGCRARAYYYNQENYMAEEPWCYRFRG
jgi:putative heme d1 biosynthesis radical SAM protein NirJ2